MKRTLTMLLIAALLTINQTNFCKAPAISGEQLIEQMMHESYITPALQRAVLSYLQDPEIFTIDPTTGMLQGIESVQTILSNIDQQLKTVKDKLTSTQKQYMQQALQALLEATEIANMNLTIKLSHKDQSILAMQKQLIAMLEDQKDAITTTLNKVNAHKAVHNDVMRWITLPSDDTRISNSMLRDIINNTDFTTIKNPVQAANILFAQCYLALQQYKANPIALNISGKISTTDYVYTKLPAIYNASSKTYPLCDQIIKAGGSALHESLVDVYQAVQMSLYIANKKSILNLSSMLPATITSYINPLVGQLLNYETHLKNLCLNPSYGATADYIAQAQTWSIATKIAIGAAAAAVAIGAMHIYDPSILNNLAQHTTDLLNWMTGNDNKLTQAELTRLQEQQKSTEQAHAQEKIRLNQQARQIEELRQADIARLEQEKSRLIANNRKTAQEKYILEQEKAELHAKNDAQFYQTVGAGLGGLVLGGAAIGMSQSGAHEKKIEELTKEHNQTKEELNSQITQLKYINDSMMPDHTKQNEKLQRAINTLNNEHNQAKEKLQQEAAQLQLKNEKLTQQINYTENNFKNLAAENAILQRKLPKKVQAPEIAVEQIHLNCDAQGHPTINAIQELMKTEYFPDLTTKQLQVTTASQGGLSEKIYCVSVNNNPVFFLKISARETQDAIQKKLTTLQTSHITRVSMLQKYAQAFKRDIHTKLPIITLMEKFYIYTKPSGFPATIELMHAAKGKELLSLLMEANPNKQKCLEAIGASLGAFQQIFMQYNNSDNPDNWKTVAHKDLNLRNIFYDEAKDQVYLIDNADMNDGQSIRNDWEELFRSLQSIFINHPGWANTFKNYFLVGYLNSFQRTQWTILIKNYFPQFSSFI